MKPWPLDPPERVPRGVGRATQRARNAGPSGGYRWGQVLPRPRGPASLLDRSSLASEGKTSTRVPALPSTLPARPPGTVAGTVPGQGGRVRLRGYRPSLAGHLASPGSAGEARSEEGGSRLVVASWWVRRNPPWRALRVRYRPSFRQLRCRKGRGYRPHPRSTRGGGSALTTRLVAHYVRGS